MVCLGRPFSSLIKNRTGVLSMICSTSLTGMCMENFLSNKKVGHLFSSPSLVSPFRERFFFLQDSELITWDQAPQWEKTEKKGVKQLKKAGACSQASELRTQQNYYNLLLAQPLLAALLGCSVIACPTRSDSGDGGKRSEREKIRSRGREEKEKKQRGRGQGGWLRDVHT